MSAHSKLQAPADSAPKPKRLPPNAGKGRVKGVPNKTTSDMRDAMRQAFDESGGVEYLKKLAKKNPGLFVQMLTKMIPAAVEQSIRGNVTYILETGVPDATDD